LDWERDNKDKGSLLRGKDLQDAELQLAINSSKEPYPTDLQRVYMFESRKDKDRQRGVMAVISIVTVITLVALASYGFYQANAAQKQANISLARQLAAQAQSLYMLGGPKNDTAILLAAMSEELYPSWEATQILQNPKLLSPVSLITYTSFDSRDVQSLDGNFWASINPNGNVRVWEAESGKEVAYLPVPEIPLPSVFSPNGRYEVSGVCEDGGDYCRGGYALVREVSSGNEIARIMFGNTVNSIAFSPDGRFVISSGCELALVLRLCGTSTVRVWEIDAAKEIAILTFDGNLGSAIFSKDGRYILSSGCATECFIRIDTLEENNERFKPPEYKDMVADTVSPNSKFRFKGEGLDAIIMDTTNGKEIKRISNEDLVNFAVFSPDSKYLAWATNTTSVVWNMGNQRKMLSINFDEAIISLSFSPDGKYIAALGCDVQHCANDGMIRILNVETGTEINRIPCPTGAISFAGDGKHVFLSCTGTPDKYVLYKPEDLIQDVCKRLSRNLTFDEWKKYIGNAKPYPSSQDNAICPKLPLSFEATPNDPPVQ
jgi:WD40 repeat protein